MPEEHCDENRNYFADVGAEQKSDNLFDVCVYTATFPYRIDYRGKVVVGQRHVGGTLCNVGAGDPHCAPDVCRFERRCVVYTVTCH